MNYPQRGSSRNAVFQPATNLSQPKTYSFLPNALNAFHPCMVPSAPHLQHTPFFDHGPSPMPRNP